MGWAERRNRKEKRAASLKRFEALLKGERMSVEDVDKLPDVGDREKLSFVYTLPKGVKAGACGHGSGATDAGCDGDGDQRRMITRRSFFKAGVLGALALLGGRGGSLAAAVTGLPSGSSLPAAIDPDKITINVSTYGQSIAFEPMAFDLRDADLKLLTEAAKIIKAVNEERIP